VSQILLNDFNDAHVKLSVCWFVSKAFCGYARPPGWSDNQTHKGDDYDASNQPGMLPFTTDTLSHRKLSGNSHCVLRDSRHVLTDICQVRNMTLRFWYKSYEQIMFYFNVFYQWWVA